MRSEYDVLAWSIEYREVTREVNRRFEEGVSLVPSPAITSIETHTCGHNGLATKLPDFWKQIVCNFPVKIQLILGVCIIYSLMVYLSCSGVPR